MNHKANESSEDGAALAQLARRYTTAAVLLHHALAEGLGLGPTDHKCLDLIRERGPMTGSELAGVTGLTTGAITGVVARLEAAGFLHRTPDPADGRKQILSPDEGRAAEIHVVLEPLRRDMAAGETARIRDTGTVDLVLRVVSSCDPTAPCLADRDTPENPGLTFTAPSSGTYWFVAEALLAAPATVGYDITVDDPPPGELCTDPLAAAIGTTLSGGDFTAAFTDDINFMGLGCSYAGGAEVVLAVTMAGGESLRINVLGSLDVVFRVLTSCDPTASCLYDQDLPENPGPLFVAPFAGTFYIVVESVLTFPTARTYDIRLVAP